MNLNRRELLYTMGAGFTLASCVKRVPPLPSVPVTVPVPVLENGSVQSTQSVTLPPPAESGIEHIVVVTMENRSFDHLLGWLPGADGKQSGLTYVDKKGVSHETQNLAPDFTGCGFNDPDHSYANSRVAYDKGAMDGFLRAGSNDTFSIGYYTEPSMPFYGALARRFLPCDRYFAAILGPTFSNRMFIWAAQTDRLTDSILPTGLTTIFDRLSSAGVSHQYYFNNVPYLALWGLKYLFSTSLFFEFLDSAAAGKLPAVSFVDPWYTVLDDGLGNDDHPHADIRNGEAFLSKIYHALASSPAWSKTVLIITFDEWGGFFEHVAPPRVTPANSQDKDEVNGKVLLGLRVPAMIVSPFTVNTAPTPQVSHTVFDHTSILKFIEWRFGLVPLTPRDASSDVGNLATAMNFTSPSSTAPDIPVANGVFAPPCFFGLLNSQAPTTPAPSTSGYKPMTQWGQLASAKHGQKWLTHPRFKDKLAKSPTQ